MRVLHLTAEFPPLIWGGLGTAVGGLALASARAGLEVKVLLVGGAWFWSYGHRVGAPERTSAAAAGLEVVPVAEAGAVAAGLRLARRWRPDVLHVHPVELWPIARESRRRTGIPIVYTVHSLNSAEYEIGCEPAWSATVSGSTSPAGCCRTRWPSGTGRPTCWWCRAGTSRSAWWCWRECCTACPSWPRRWGGRPPSWSTAAPACWCRRGTPEPSPP